MKMASMEKPASESKGDKVQEISTPGMVDDGPSIHLSEHHIKKLGLNKMPSVGSHIVLHAHARVESTSQHGSKGKMNRSMSLSITRMAASKRPAPASAVEAARNGIEDADGAGDA